MRLIIGIDPGTGISSPTGFAILNPDEKVAIDVVQFTSQNKKHEHRLKEIAEEVGEAFRRIDEAFPQAEVTVYYETFVMRGKAGENLARLTGAITSRIPNRFASRGIFNTTVKKLVGGHGHADKDVVAIAALNWLYGKGAALNAAYEMYSPDEKDAIAIAIAGYLRDQEERQQAAIKTEAKEKKLTSVGRAKPRKAKRKSN